MKIKQLLLLFVMMLQITSIKIIAHENYESNIAESIPRGDEVFTTAAQMPSFPGGEKALYEYCGQNIRYPQDAADNNIQGTVIVKFVVEKDGRVGQVEVLQSVDRSLDNEARRVCKSLPKFSPGRNAAGEPVRIWVTMPFDFYLTPNSGSSQKKWVTLTKDFNDRIAIFDVRINTDTHCNTNQNIGVIFAGETFNPNGGRMFLNTHNWKYNLSSNVDGKNQVKLSKSPKDNEGYHHIDILQNHCVFIHDIQENALVSNIQVLVEEEQYILASNNPDQALSYLEKNNYLIDYPESARAFYDFLLKTFNESMDKHLSLGIDEAKEDSIFKLQEKFSQSVPEANYRLGCFYNYGYGTDIDLAKAKEYYEKAAQCGHVEAVFHCALFAADGIACKKDPVKAFEYAKKAAEKGSENAKGLLARCYSEGIGVEKDKSMGDKLRFEKKDGVFYIDAYSLFKKAERVHKELIELWGPSIAYGDEDNRRLNDVLDEYVTAWALGIEDAGDRFMELRFQSDNPYKNNLSKIRPKYNSWSDCHGLKDAILYCGGGIRGGKSTVRLILNEYNTPKFRTLAIKDMKYIFNKENMLYHLNIFIDTEYRDGSILYKSQFSRSEKELLKIMVKEGIEEAIEFYEKLMLNEK